MDIEFTDLQWGAALVAPLRGLPELRQQGEECVREDRVREAGRRQSVHTTHETRRHPHAQARIKGVARRASVAAQ